MHSSVEPLCCCGNSYDGTVRNENQIGDKTLWLKPEASGTASLIKIMDELFDSLNGSTFQSKHGKMLRVAVKKNSPHLQFWYEALIVLKRFKCRKNDTLFKPPSFKNFHNDHNEFQAFIWQIIKSLRLFDAQDI